MDGADGAEIPQRWDTEGDRTHSPRIKLYWATFPVTSRWFFTSRENKGKKFQNLVFATGVISLFFPDGAHCRHSGNDHSFSLLPILNVVLMSRDIKS